MNYIQLFDKTNAKKYLKKIQSKYELDNKEMSQVLKVEQDWYTRYIEDTYEDIETERLGHIVGNLLLQDFDVEIDFWWRDIFNVYGNLMVPKTQSHIIEKDVRQHFDCQLEREQSELCPNSIIIKLKK